MVLSDIILPILILVIFILSKAIKIVNEYERVVIFRLGRLSGIKGPGLFLIIPIIDTVVKIDLRVVTIDVPKQNVITKDNVTVDVDAVVYYKVVEPSSAVNEVENYKYATSTLSQTTLRDAIGQIELDELLSKREEINRNIQEMLDVSTDPWGIKVTGVTLRDVKIDDTMLRAIAKQAEAEREKRARIILAEGEYIAAEKMQQAAKLYQDMPAGLKLRELQTIAEVAREKNLIVISNSMEIGGMAAMSKAFSEKNKG
ncbi:membrane protease subunit, stomatin/prohibitin [Methanomethylovorans hollandica DSM 15978]|uniref:Membrane protease subunit, stomatin/prohibitin n=1 Tax=Methanomethylovorans hollandica (strain DSM 15978 / NBRC 107637 / DMS1) TaxID=867904 RepID=L0KZE8_METHD|nr:slipin family protein [Methanomethylovorans hollandica]AGB50486.1 membrane protease subunit, stomatin/prohibitin [Methanomethylovorans hollandica DSM 15978]